MKKAVLIGFFLILNHLLVFGQQNDSWKSLSENNYSIEYPSEWQLNQTGKMGTSFILYSPLESKQDLFKENVNLLIQDLTGLELNLDKYIAVSEGQIKKMIATNGNGKIISSERITNHNGPYQKIIYTNKQGDFDLQFEQYYFIQNNQAYILTLNCEKSQFNSFQTKGERILNSFKFLVNE